MYDSRWWLTFAAVAAVGRGADVPHHSPNMTSSSLLPKPSIIHVVIDDLGYDDPNFRNGQVLTPTIDRMVAEGVEIKEFYVYKMCAPSRASVLSGRYPMHVGYYNNNGCTGGGVPLSFDLLPAVLKSHAGYRTHALGKWHIGWTTRAYTPTFRGFDTFLGTSGNTGDYWYHFLDTDRACKDIPHVDLPGKDTVDGRWPVVDMAEASAGTGIVGPANRSDVNGTYDSRLLAKRAVSIIEGHPTSSSSMRTPQFEPLFLYLALHNVHVPMHAPLSTVQLFPRVSSDARKVADAMLLEADWAISNVSGALNSTGMLDNSVFFVHTDNGGPGSHACNFPLRGGKFTFWEGGVRGMAFVYSPLLPLAVRGTQFKGMAHLTDIYMTAAVGLAGIDASLLMPPNASGPIPPDGLDLWTALSSGTASPRTEVLHLPLNNQYYNTSAGVAVNQSHGYSPSMRMGRYKVILGWPGGDAVVPLPPLAQQPVAYGLSKGSFRHGYFNSSTAIEAQAVGPHWKDQDVAGVNHSKSTCMSAPGIPKPCLFDVVSDVSESHDLSDNPAYADTLNKLMTRLQELSKSAAPVCDGMTQDEFSETLEPHICAAAVNTGYWLPADWAGTMPPPPESACQKELDVQCPIAKYPTTSACEMCFTRAQNGDPELLPNCRPREKPIVCNRTRSDPTKRLK